MNQEYRHRLHSSARWNERAGDVEASINYRPIEATARRRAEGLKMLDTVLRETYESEERFRLLANAAPALIWMSDTDKLCTFINKSWLKFTGRSMDSELGNGWTEVVHPEDLRRHEDTYTQAFDRRDEFRIEYRLRRHDGEYRWILDIGVPRFDKDRSFVGYIGIGIDVTERKLAEIALTSMSGKLIEAQERERTRIARELHDDFSQRLAILSMGLTQLWEAFPQSDAKGRAKVQEMLTGTKELSSDLHALAYQLHSSRLDHLGLASAIAGHCKEISEKYKIEVHFIECDLHLAIPKDVALCLFRVAQEALGNVVKHSQAKGVHVELRAIASGVSLRISDDGRGFDTDLSSKGAGLGLIGMRERIRLVAGELLVKSGPKRGTEILAEVPLCT
jgi:PAS domain S-box-containing protein